MTSLQQRAQDYRWLAPHIVQMFVIVALIWGWKSEMEVRVKALEYRIAQSDQVIERVTRMEENVKALYIQSDRIEKKLDIALERRR